MSNGVRITRSDRRKLQQLIRETPDRADELVRAVATEMVGDIVTSFGTSPAPAGSPPGVDTGDLRASIRFEPDGKMRALIHDGVEYGVYQELGTETVAARPFMNPVFERWRQRKFGQFVRDFGVYE